MAEEMLAPVKSRNAADEDYHCFSGRIETEIEYDPEKQIVYRGKKQRVPFASFRMVSNANPKSFKATAHYECRAWGKAAERIHGLEITKGFGLVCWARYRTERIVHKATATKPASENEYSHFQIDRFVIKSFPKPDDNDVFNGDNEEESDGDSE